MADECRCSGAGSMFLSFVMGAVIGGGIALLNAPRSGEETRKRLRDGADDVRDRLKEIVEEAEGKINQALEEGKEAVEQRREMVKSAYEAGKEAMEQERAKHQKPAS